MKHRIVIADDDSTITSLVSLRLGMAQYEVLAARDGEEAMRLIRENAPAAVILDMQMPGRSGMEVLGAIKADPATSKLPVMMLTGERGPEIVMEAVGAGADDYMVKPFHPDRLLERVSRLVRATGPKTASVWEL